MTDYPESASTAPTPPKPAHPLRRELAELGKTIALFLALFWLMTSYVVEGYEVQGYSMLPTLQDHECILVFKLPQALSKLSIFSSLEPIHDGDIVVFNSPIEKNKRYIKRVLAQGAPAQHNTVLAHQVELEEAGVEVRFDRGTVYVDGKAVDEEYLPPEQRGGAERRPTLELGTGEFYVLGDNRSVSKDSRSFGAIHDTSIIGRAVLRIWPLQKFGWL